MQAHDLLSLSGVEDDLPTGASLERLVCRSGPSAHSGSLSRREYADVVGPILRVLEMSSATTVAERAGLRRREVCDVLDPGRQSPLLHLLRLARLAQVELFGLVSRDLVTRGPRLDVDEQDLLDRFRTMTCAERERLLASATDAV